MSSNLSQIYAARPITAANLARGDVLLVADVSETAAANKDKGIVISELNRALAGTHNAQTWSGGALTLTPAGYVGRHLEVLTVTLGAGAATLTIADGTANTRFAGERLDVLFLMPVTSGIVITVQNSTGDVLAYVATDGTGESCFLELYHNGTKWAALRKTLPTGV
jgi:hypothetical protein